MLFLPIFTLIKSLPCCFEREKSVSRNILIESLNHLMSQGMTPLQFIGRCTFFCLLWLMTNYLLVFTLRRLDVTVVMALFACSVTAVYLFSWVVLHHQFVGMRIVAVIICDTGIALIAYMDGTNSKTIRPVVLAASAAVSSSIYKVFYHRMIGYRSYGELSLFFTLIGLLNLLLMWPLVLLLYFTGTESLSWHHIPWLPLSAAAALNLTANILTYVGLYCTYEVFLSTGIMLAIPFCSGTSLLPILLPEIPVPLILFPYSLPPTGPDSLTHTTYSTYRILHQIPLSFPSAPHSHPSVDLFSRP